MAVAPHISTQNLEGLVNVARQFALLAVVADVQPFGSGNINDTFIVSLDALEAQRFILQRINTQVFREPKLVMQNMRISTEHVRNRLCQNSVCADRRWEVPRVLLTQNGDDHWVDADGSFWRAISFIEDSLSLDTVQDPNHAQEVGYALGTFHRLISDLPPEALADTLEGFHITPGYLEQYEEILLRSEPDLSPEVKYCLTFVHRRKEFAHVLETAKAQGKLPIRPIHGDPKVNNVMVDVSTGQAVSMIDLDTVKPGLIHYDIGDCLRSGCNPKGEETKEWEEVRFEVDLAQAMLQGYFTEAGHFLTAYDYDYLYDAIRLIAFELGLRFFTDYLAHNIYFKVKYPEHNLARALVQFKLTESIEAQAADLRTLIQEMRTR